MEEVDDPPGSLQLGNVAVEVHPVQAGDIQRDMAGQPSNSLIDRSLSSGADTSARGLRVSALGCWRPSMAVASSDMVATRSGLLRGPPPVL
jgi:hypothetical protein